MMNKEQKKNYISEMTSQFENSKAIMVTHYQGLTMTQLDELRAKMREHGIIFKITKNRITKLALEKTIFLKLIKPQSLSVIYFQLVVGLAKKKNLSPKIMY